jgi:hypothetical protein
MISLTGETPQDASKAIATLQKFVVVIPPRLITRTAKAMGAARAAELKKFLDDYEREASI